LVTDESDRLVGIFSERDVLLRIVGVTEQYEELPVRRFMTANPEAISVRDKIVFALHKMDGGDYRHLPVVDAGHPVGIISVRDVLRYIRSLCKE
jgi:CBS domain-containing protein